MPPENTSLSAQVADAFQNLTESAKRNRVVRDELSRLVSSLEQALARLSLCIGCWTLISESTNDGIDYERLYVGFQEMNHEWRIVIKSANESEHRPEEPLETKWLFDSAPQFLRLRAIDKLADLIDGLSKTTDSTTERLKKKLDTARNVASGVQVAQTKKG
jgi:hypothetical protein